jgi:biopolymer transport protein ExbB/TolQ
MTFDPEIEAVLQACGRTARLVHRKMGRGRASLAGIASSAPFVGVLATVVGIVTSFRGVNGEKTAAMAFLTGLLSEAIIPTAAGILVAIFAAWGHSYLCRQLESVDLEMRVAALELANSLSLLRQRN